MKTWRAGGTPTAFLPRDETVSHDQNTGMSF